MRDPKEVKDLLVASMGISMPHYIALVDGEPGAYGVSFPDAPGSTAMAGTIEKALLNARIALGEWIAHARANNLEVRRPRTIDELLKDPEFIEEQAESLLTAYVRAIEHS